MDAKKCDACGALYEIYNGHALFPKTCKANSLKFINSDTGAYGEYDKMNICPDCMAKVVSVLFPESNENDENKDNRRGHE